MSLRTRKLRDELIDIVPQICPERAGIFTQSMKETDGQPNVIRRARAFYEVLNKMSIYIRDDELIVGNQAGRPRSAPVYPEYSTEWIVREFNGDPYHFYERPNDIYHYDEETKNELLDIINYWEGKTIYKNLRELLPEKAKMAWDIGAIDDDWVTQNGFGNILPDYEVVLKQGLRGVTERARAKMDELDLTEPGNARKHWFLQSVITSNQAVINFARRYADKIEQMAKNEDNKDRKAELEEMAKNCRRVPENPPGSFWEALQAVWFIHLGIQMETNGIAISFGRFDQYMWPYYKNDIEKGTITREKALELVEAFFIKSNELCVFRSWAGAKFFPGYHMAVNLAVGGQTKDGKDAVNDLTYIVLDACENIRLPRPSVSVKWFEGTSQEFMDRALEVVQKNKGGQPAFYNDPGVMRMLKNMGIAESDLWNWAPVGCIEASIPGKWDFACKGPRMNKAKILEITLNNGKDPATGITLLPGDGDLTTFKSAQEIMNAFKKQLHFYMEQQVIIEHMNDELHIQHDINTFRASLIEDCIGRGKSLIEGGSIYSAEGGPTVGAITAGDCIAAIETAVFDKKWITGEQLQHALKTNFEDNSTSPTGEEIRLMLWNKVSKFGNDDDKVDKWSVAVTDYIGSTYLKDFKNSRYGKGPIPAAYSYCQSSVTANVAMGNNVGATPDGRKAGKPLNNGVSPSTGVERNGITAVINSAGKLPSIWFSRGAIFNVRLTPETLQSPEGRKRVSGLIKTLFENYQYHIQFNVVGTDTLRDAQEHPENYKDLMVRVAGYSAFFAPLNSELQEDIIKRIALD